MKSCWRALILGGIICMLSLSPYQDVATGTTSIVPNIVKIFNDDKTEKIAVFTGFWFYS